jgi:hypothetical protein
MPFSSHKQAQWMKENRPDLYEEFRAETKDISSLPIRSPKEKEKRKKEAAKNKQNRMSKGKRARYD